MPEKIEFRAPAGLSRALDALAERSFEPRAAVIRRALLKLLNENGVEVRK